MKDLLALLPFPDEVSVIELTGQQLLHALENSVSVYPILEGNLKRMNIFFLSFIFYF